MDASEADGHDVRAPVGGGGAGAVARGDPAAVEGHGHVVCAARRLLDARRQVEPWNRQRREAKKKLVSLFHDGSCKSPNPASYRTGYKSWN